MTWLLFSFFLNLLTLCYIYFNYTLMTKVSDYLYQSFPCWYKLPKCGRIPLFFNLFSEWMVAWAQVTLWCVFLLLFVCTPAGENRSADDNDSGWPHAHRSRQAPENHWGSPQSSGQSQKSSVCVAIFPVYTQFYTFYAFSLPHKHFKTSFCFWTFVMIPCSTLC